MPIYLFVPFYTVMEQDETATPYPGKGGYESLELAKEAMAGTLYEAQYLEIFKVGTDGTCQTAAAYSRWNGWRDYNY